MRTLNEIFKTLAIIAIIATTTVAQSINLVNGENREEWFANKGGGSSSSSSVTAKENGIEFTVTNGSDWASIEFITVEKYDWDRFTNIDIAYTCDEPIAITFADPLLWDYGAQFRAELPAAPSGTYKTVYLSDFRQPSWVIYDQSIPKPNLASRLNFIEGVAVIPLKTSVTTGAITNFIVNGMDFAGAKYSVTFNSNGGSVVSQMTNIASGSTINQPSNPTKSGHIFTGWFKDINLTNRWDFATDVVTEDINLYARWTATQSVNLVNGEWSATSRGSGSSASVTLKENEIEFVTSAAPPSGWANIERTALEYDWSGFTSIDITYISNQPIRILLNDPLFWSTGGSFEAELPPATTATNRTITLSDFRQPSWVIYDPSVPRPNLASRLEFFYGVAVGSLDFGTTTGTITNFTVNGLAHAEDKYSVTFNSNGGSVVSNITNLLNGSKISQPSNPTKYGYAFAGWFKNAILTNQWNFASDVVTEDITLYAKWTALSYAIEYVLDGGTNNSSNPTTYNVESGNLTIQSASKAGYNFGGWFSNPNLTGIPITSIFTGSAGNITLYAKWVVNPLESYNIKIPPFFTAYTGSPIKIPSLVYQNTITLEEGRDYVTEYTNNIDVGTASVKITGMGSYSQIGVVTHTFEIHKRIVNVIWGDPVLGWHGEAQAPTAKSSDNELFKVKITGQKTDIGDNYIATAELVNPNPNIALINASLDYSIVRRNIEVVWENTGPLVYNKMVQAPKAIALINKGDGTTKSVNLALINSHSQVGAYTGQQAPLAFIINENERENIRLTNNTIDYEILKRQLDIVIIEDGKPTNSIVVDKTIITDEDALLEYIKSILKYDGFAKDTVSEESDNGGVLNGEPTFEIQKTSTRSLEKGEYVVKIKTNGITAKNYSIKEREVIVSVNELETNELETSIRDIPKSDSRYGIRFAKSVVSDKLEIMDVIIPVANSDKTESAKEIKVVVYDNTGNVVFSTAQKGNKAVWNLTNSYGRNVANGGYLVIVEAKGRNGKIYPYSAKVGVRR